MEYSTREYIALSRKKQELLKERESFLASLELAKKIQLGVMYTYNQFSLAINEINQNFLINGKSADNGQIEKNNKEMRTLLKSNTGTLISSIKLRIKLLEDKITVIDKQLLAIKKSVLN